MAKEVSKDALRRGMQAVRQATPEEVKDALHLNLPEVRSMRVMNSREVEKLGIGVEGRLLVESVEGMADSLDKLGKRIEEKAQEIAGQKGRAYREGAIHLGVTEIGINAIKDGMKYSGDPIFVGWKLGPEVCEFTVIDSGREDFEPLRYADMPLMQYIELPDIAPGRGHMGIKILVGSRAPGEETEGLLRKEDIQWIAIRNERGERIGTKVEFKVRSEEKA
ncbi:MAG: ATP-binding protein [Candidatus Altiarchaeales archaeon]|nr:ATP-binding protein [Candidatus Altiarchaeales archaeon]